MRKAALETVGRLVSKDPRVVFIGSDLGVGTLKEVRELHPDRVFMEGIAEQHLVGFAAGLAHVGFLPIVHTIATFLTRRSLEQIIVDVALERLPVVLLGAGGGMVYAPLGPTHQSIDDFALMRAIPGISVVAPADPIEMTLALELLVAEEKPAYVRIAKGGERVITESLSALDFGRMRPVIRGTGIAILTTGALLSECVVAAKELLAEGIAITVTHFPFVSPIDKEAILELASSHQHLLVVEEHMPIGGLSSAVADVLSDVGFSSPLHRRTLPASYATKYGSQSQHWQLHGLDAKGIKLKIFDLLGRKP